MFVLRFCNHVNNESSPAYIMAVLRAEELFQTNTLGKKAEQLGKNERR